MIFLEGIFRLIECIGRLRQKRGVLGSCEKACDVLESHGCSTYRYLSPAVVPG